MTSNANIGKWTINKRIKDLNIQVLTSNWNLSFKLQLEEPEIQISNGNIKSCTSNWKNSSFKLRLESS